MPQQKPQQKLQTQKFPIMPITKIRLIVSLFVVVVRDRKGTEQIGNGTGTHFLNFSRNGTEREQKYEERPERIFENVFIKFKIILNFQRGRRSSA